MRVDAVPFWPSLFGVMALALALVENELFVKHNLMHILFVAIPVAVSLQTGRHRAAAVLAQDPWRSGPPAVEAQQA